MPGENPVGRCVDYEDGAVLLMNCVLESQRVGIEWNSPTEWLIALLC